MIKTQKTDAQKVIELRHDNPTWSLQDIGNQCLVSKQRVHTILKKYNEKTAGIHSQEVRCANCGSLVRKANCRIDKYEIQFCGRKCQGQYLGKGLYKTHHD